MSTLDNGLRVITDQVPSIHSVALGVWVGVGTRNEEMIHNGAAHMVEHMLFKGTKNRSALDIAQQIENAGGSMNAYTSREITSYHMHLLKDDAPLALNVLADMLLQSTMPEEEIEHERHVILQEIGMCHDTPDDVIFDNYYETAYPGQALGAPILGKVDIINAMGRDTLMNYVRNLYTPANMVISASGGIDHDSFVAQAQDLFGGMAKKKPTENFLLPIKAASIAAIKTLNKAISFSAFAVYRAWMRVLLRPSAVLYFRRRDVLAPVSRSAGKARTGLFCVLVPQRL